eukprot:1772286-Ditylum_brightwellii.AAC.1
MARQKNYAAHEKAKTYLHEESYPLHAAIAKDNSDDGEVVETLLTMFPADQIRRECTVDIESFFGCLPNHLSLSSSHPDMLLSSSNIDDDDVDDEEELVAPTFAEKEVCSADIHALSALQLAIYVDKPHIVRVLLKSSSGSSSSVTNNKIVDSSLSSSSFLDANATDELNRTPLMLA